MKTKRPENRIVTLLLVVIFLLNLFGPVPLKLVAESSNEESKSGVLDFGDAELKYTQKLTKLSDKEFEFTINLSAVSSVFKSNESGTNEESGYFVAPADGDYVIQAWGGRGGNGASRIGYIGGIGGAGGYVYGKIHLEKGEKLYYELGGNGGRVLSGGEGGAFGGGSHGVNGEVPVGAGGGYSAIYKLTANQQIGDVDKSAAVLLIAGGGGGGGAYPTLGTNIAYGGDAGTVSGGAAGTTITNVGTYYPGKNGTSSGSDKDYVGKGGANIPGAAVSTADGDYSSSAGKKFSDGGNGGDGNLRGGGGGAGYTGGSGGIMFDLVDARYVGGGGGGSSFISVNVDTALDAAEMRKLSANTSDSGCVSISLAGSDSDPLAYLSNITFSADASDYFDVTNVSVEGTGAPTSTTAGFSVSNASVYNDGELSDITIKVRVKAKDGFPGGNDVPLFADDTVTIAPDGKTDMTLSTADKTGYVNVPLDFTAIGNICTYDKTVASSVPVLGTALYTENAAYLSAKNNAGSGLYSFIESVGDYKVDGETPDASYAPDDTTKYNVSFTVTPVDRSNSKATIGEVVAEKTFTALAVINVIKNGQYTLNGSDYEISKSLTYDAGIYNLRFSFSGNSYLIPRNADSKLFKKGEDSFVVPESGFYLVQAWGGAGGDGGFELAVGTYEEGGNGANGGYADNVVYLATGTTIYIDFGSKGNNGSEYSGIYNLAKGGNGGTQTKVYTVNQTSTEYIAIGGGGGGGGGAVIGIGGGPGVDGKPDSSAVLTTLPKNMDDFNGKNGGDAGRMPLSAIVSPGSGGFSGKNYSNSSISKLGVLSEQSQINVNAFLNETKNSYGEGDGVVVITPLIKSYDSFVVDFSEYFTLEDVTSTGIVTTGGKAFSCSLPDSENAVTVSKIYPEIVGTSADTFEDVEFSLTFSMKPIEGFLGGNDVPLLESAVLSQEDTNSVDSDNSVSIEAQDDTDYVNVKIPEFTITGHDAEYVIGGTPVAMENMYEDTLPTVADGSILDDFVTIENISVDPTFNGAPEEDTTYTFSAEIEPKTATPEKAVVIPTATAVEKSAQATIYVFASVKHTLTHITCDDQSSTPVVKPLKAEYMTTLVPDTDYVLPSSITVKRGGTVLPATSYTYNKETGRVILPADLMTGAMEIIADAIEATGSITIVRENSASEGNGTQTFVYEISDGTNVYYATVTGNSQTSVYCLPFGDYTVTQMSGWSGRFSDSTKTVTVDSSEGETVTFNAAATEEKWLNATDAPKVNIKKLPEAS